MLRPLSPPVPCGAVDARHLVGDHFRCRAARVRRRIPQGHRRGAAGRICRRHRHRLSRSDQSAGRGRACRQAGPRHRGRRAHDGRSSAREGGQPRIHEELSRGVREQDVQPSDTRGRSGVRNDARRKSAARRTLHQRGRRAASPSCRVHRQRGPAQTVRRDSAGRRNGSHRRPVVRGRRCRRRKGPTVQLQPARQVLCLHSLDDDERADRYEVRQHVPLAGGVAVGRAAGHETGARVLRGPVSLQPRRRARAESVRVVEAERNRRSDCERPEGGADVHRRPDARHRRRRHHEHHVRQRPGADA